VCDLLLFQKAQTLFFFTDLISVEKRTENLNAGIALAISYADILVLKISYTVLFEYAPEPVELKSKTTTIATSMVIGCWIH
jgi:hypothetical protein